MIQSLGMWWICEEQNLKCISVSFTNKLHCNQMLCSFSPRNFGKVWISMHGGTSMSLRQSNHLVLDFCNNHFGLKRQPTNSIWNRFL